MRAFVGFTVLSVVFSVALCGTTVVNNQGYYGAGQQKQKDLIYVLQDNKQINVQQPQLTVQQDSFQKPEVFFLKNNLPTQVTRSNVQYQTVSHVPGAPYGAVNGVPNKVSTNNGQFQDAASNPEQDRISQAIYQALQSGGLPAGLAAVDELIAAGLPVSAGRRRRQN